MEQTYNSEIEKLFDENFSKMGLKKEDRDNFVLWACERHVRLRQRDKRWIDRQETTSLMLPDARSYFEAVYEALKCCGGKDRYTGEELNWKITLSQEPNEFSEIEKRQNRVTFDHKNGRNLEKLEFAVCAGRTNDAKNDLPMGDFVKLCISLLTNNGYTVLSVKNKPFDSSGQ